MRHLEKNDKPEHFLTHCKPLSNFENIINVSKENAEKYLRGEVIKDEKAKDGYIVVAFENLGLGWGKAKDGVIKNHYPKGLRNLN